MTGVPHSAGTAQPSAAAPAGACDAHCHIVDPRFPPCGAGGAAGAPVGMTIEDYQQLQRRVGTTRAVFVQAKYHGTDHACLLDAIRRLNGNARGIGVLHPSVADGELERLDASGIRGLRFSLWNPADAVVTIDMIEPLAKRIAELGWHVQLHLSGDQIIEAAPLLARLPCPIVFDHMGRLPPDRGPDHPAFAVIVDLVSKGRAWVKLAGAYLNTGLGPPYDDATRIARAYVAQVPERLVWGSDWPHITETHKPDGAALYDLLAVWAGSDRVRDLILIENPAELYGFR